MSYVFVFHAVRIVTKCLLCVVNTAYGWSYDVCDTNSWGLSGESTLRCSCVEERWAEQISKLTSLRQAQSQQLVAGDGWVATNNSIRASLQMNY